MQLNIRGYTLYRLVRDKGNYGNVLIERVRGIYFDFWCFSLDCWTVDNKNEQNKSLNSRHGAAAAVIPRVGGTARYRAVQLS